MTGNHKLLTILISLTCIILGLVISYFTDWYFVIPILFGLGIPSINMQGTLKQKMGKLFVILIVTTSLFIGSFMAMLGSFINMYWYTGLVLGIAGLTFFGINALLIENITFNYKSAIITTVLSGITIPLWIFLTTKILTVDSQTKLLGAMTLWMIAVTLGISTGIKNKKTTANNK